MSAELSDSVRRSLNRYFRDLVAPAADSIIKEVDHIILFSRGNKETYQYFMVYFVQKYITPEYMGQDAVFVHLFEKYINTGQTDFFTQEYMDYIREVERNEQEYQREIDVIA